VTFAEMVLDDLQATGGLECNHGRVKDGQYGLLKLLIFFERFDVESLALCKLNPDWSAMCPMFGEIREPLSNGLGLC
jgi:hypothetical protein